MKDSRTEHTDRGTAETSGQSQRRRLLVGGMAGGILATLKSGNALAEGVCASPSAFTSIALNPATSRRPQQLPQCHSHGYWKNHSWPISRDTTVSGAGFCLGNRLTAIHVNADTKLYTILDNKDKSIVDGEDRALAADLISAYLDAAAGFAANQFTTTDIKKMWALVFCGQPYTVNGVSWTVQTVRAFLDVLIGKKKPWP